MLSGWSITHNMFTILYMYVGIRLILSFLVNHTEENACKSSDVQLPPSIRQQKIAYMRMETNMSFTLGSL